MILEDVKPFNGQHCETTATGTLLNQLGMEFSEPMLFGIGQGLSFIYWNMKTMDYPFMGGRVKPEDITIHLAENLDLELKMQETSSEKKAWENVKSLLDKGIAVGLKLDCYHLEYFSRAFHFAAHYVAIYGYDDQYAYLADTVQQGGGARTSLESLALARSERGPMASRNLYFTLVRNEKEPDIKKAVLSAIRNNATYYLNPPITNMCHKGILKAGKEIIRWFDHSTNIEEEFGITAMLMEKAGTGGALFRNLYRDFLKESYDLSGIEEIGKAHQSFIEIAKNWNDVSSLLEKTAKTQSRDYILEASELMKEISGREKKAMEVLESIIK